MTSTVQSRTVLDATNLSEVPCHWMIQSWTMAVVSNAILLARTSGIGKWFPAETCDVEPYRAGPAKGAPLPNNVEHDDHKNEYAQRILAVNSGCQELLED